MTLESRLDQFSRSWRGPLLAALIAMVAGLPSLLAVPPLDRDESRFAQATAQMLETEDYVTINYQDQPRDKKPVGIHWLQAAAVSAVSDVADRDIWAFRIPSLLGAMLAAAACAWGASAFFGPRAGLLAGAMMGASFLLSTEAGIAKTDAVLAGCTTLAMAALGRLYGASQGLNTAGWRTRLLLWLGISVGILIKGPVVVAVFGLALLALLIFEPLTAAIERLAFAIRQRSVGRLGWRLLPWAAVAIGLLLQIGVSSAAQIKATRDWPLLDPVGLAGAVLILVGVVVLIAAEFWKRRPLFPDAPWIARIGWKWGLVLILAVCGPWAWAITVASDGAFWGAAIGGDLAPKLAGGHERHGGMFGYHLLLSPMLTFPGCLLMPAGLVLGWKARGEPGARFALCWLIPTWLMFELLPTKLVHYTLPGLGGLFWLMAASLREPLGKASRVAGTAMLGFASFVFIVICIGAMAEYGDASDLIWVVITILLFLATAVAGGVLIFRKAAGTALVAAGALGVLAHAAFFGQLAPRMEPLWLSERVALALASSGLAPKEGVVPGPVEVAGYAEPSLVFALGTTTGLGGPNEAVAAIAEGRPAVVEKREQADFLAAMASARLTPRPVKTVNGIDYSNGDEMSLTLYRGEPQTIARPVVPVPESE